MCEKYLVQITGKYSMFAENEKEAVQRALKHLESDVGFCVDSPYKAKQVFYIKTEKKQEGEYKRGRVEELKKFISWAEEESEGWQMSLDCYPTQLQLSKQIKELEGVE